MVENRPQVEPDKEIVPEAIIVLGSGLEKTKNNPPGLKLSWDERMRLTAAVQLYRELSEKGSCPKKIIVCGGAVYGGFSPLAHFEKRELTRAFGIDESIVLTADKSLNTLEDIEDAQELMKKEGLSSAVVISNDYHKVAKVFAEKKGLRFLSAEELLRRRNRLYLSVVNDINQSQLVRKLRKTQGQKISVLSLPGGEAIYKSQANRDKKGIIPGDFDPNFLKSLVTQSKSK